MTLYLRILSYIKPYLTRLILAAICTAMAAAGNLYVPWIIKDVIDYAIEWQCQKYDLTFGGVGIENNY